MKIEVQRKIKSSIQTKSLEDIKEVLDSLKTDLLIDGSTALAHAVNSYSIDTVKYLIEKGADVNIKHESGYPPIFSAIDNSRKDLIEMLLNNGADVNIQDSHGNDSLFRAVDTYDLEIVKLVVDAGANPFRGNNPENYSSYDCAIDIGATDIVEYFDSIKSTYS